MRLAALALLFPLAILSPAAAREGALAGSGSSSGQAENPSEAQRYYERGLAEARQGKDAAAISDFEQSIALDPDRFETYEALDGVLSKHRQWATAVQYWTEYIQLHPSDGHAYCERGAAYSWLHDAVHMQADVEEACSLGDQRCCELDKKFRAQQASSPEASSREPLPLKVLAVFALLVSVPALLIIWLVIPRIRHPKGRGALDHPEAMAYVSASGGSPGKPGKLLSLATGGSSLDRPGNIVLLAGVSVLITILCVGTLGHFVTISDAAFGALTLSMLPAVMGVYLFVRGFAIYREFRAMLVTPESPIRGLAMGFVEVHGKATGPQTVPSPIGKTPCLFYKVILEGEGKGPLTPARRQRARAFSRVDVGGVNFYLEDATGKVRVDPTGVECDLLLNNETRIKVPRSRAMKALGGRGAPSPSPEEELINYAYDLAPDWDYITDCHFLEYCVLPGHWYDLLGTCGENPEPQDEADRNMIAKGSEELTFVISWRSEKGIKARVRRRAAYDVYAGGALILLGATLGLAMYHLF